MYAKKYLFANGQSTEGLKHQNTKKSIKKHNI